MDTKPLSLYELLSRTRASIKAAMPESYWILAEISEMKVNYSGHCYLELIDKAEDSDQIKARVRATIWSSTFRMLKPYFETTTRTRLETGLKIMIEVTVEMHELYGFSLNIIDIEPSYTIGELARQKQEIINQLVDEGIFEMNKKLTIPQLPKKIAVVSSLTAAGYGDFRDQLMNNPFGYQFHMKLFPAVMQGDEAEHSMINALEHIFNHVEVFDVVVLIRGGGSQSELNCFNNYWLCSHICQFPLPVLTGIGHERDETIADMVAHTRLKTPTAVAEFIISQFRTEEDRINELTDELIDSTVRQINSGRNHLNRIAVNLKPAVREQVMKHHKVAADLKLGIIYMSRQLIAKHRVNISKRTGRLQTSMQGLFLKLSYRQSVSRSKLESACRTYLEKHNHLLNLYEKKNQYLDPFQILERGYSITYHNGKTLRSDENIPSGEIIETRLRKGKLKSRTI